jgi:hypothetical protein
VRHNVRFHVVLAAQHSRSVTAAGEPSFDQAGEQPISESHRKQKERRLLAAGSGLAGRAMNAFTSCQSAAVGPIHVA